MGGTDSAAAVLGSILAGNTHGALSTTCAHADRALMPKQTLCSTQKNILRVIDSAFEEFLLKSRTALHEEASRKLIVPKDCVLLLKHEQQLYDVIDTPFGLKVAYHFDECMFGSCPGIARSSESFFPLCVVSRTAIIRSTVKSLFVYSHEGRFHLLPEFEPGSMCPILLLLPPPPPLRHFLFCGFVAVRSRPKQKHAAHGDSGEPVEVSEAGTTRRELEAAIPSSR